MVNRNSLLAILSLFVILTIGSLLCLVMDTELDESGLENAASDIEEDVLTNTQSINSDDEVGVELTYYNSYTEEEVTITIKDGGEYELSNESLISQDLDLFDAIDELEEIGFTQMDG